MKDPTSGLCSPVSKARPSCSLLHPRCNQRLLSSMLFWGGVCEKSAGFCFHPDVSFKVLIMLYGGKNSGQVLPLRTHIIQTFGLTSVRVASRKAKLWILGGNRATFSIIPFRKTSSKLNYVMTISSFKPSAGQVGAGPGSEQYPLWVMGWGKDRSALLQEIPGNAGAPLNMSTVWLHHLTCQKPPWLSNWMMQVSVRVLQRYPLILAGGKCLHVRIFKRS